MKYITIDLVFAIDIKFIRLTVLRFVARNRWKSMKSHGAINGLSRYLTWYSSIRLINKLINVVNCERKAGSKTLVSNFQYISMANFSSSFFGYTIILCYVWSIQYGILSQRNIFTNSNFETGTTHYPKKKFHGTTVIYCVRSAIPKTFFNNIQRSLWLR